MKLRSAFCKFAMLGVVLLLNACHFESAVFTDNLAKTDGSLAGIWIAQDAGDPRTAQYAVFAPIDGDRYLLHHPARSSDSFYYEARSVKCRDRMLMQLRVLATFNGGPPRPEFKRFTLLWLERKGDDRLFVRPIDGDGGLAGMTPADARKALEDPDTDWESFFDKGQEYRRLKRR